MEDTDLGWATSPGAWRARSCLAEGTYSWISCSSDRICHQAHQFVLQSISWLCPLFSTSTTTFNSHLVTGSGCLPSLFASSVTPLLPHSPKKIQCDNDSSLLNILQWLQLPCRSRPKSLTWPSIHPTGEFPRHREMKVLRLLSNKTRNKSQVS